MGQPERPDRLTWAMLRPVLLAMAVVSNLFVVLALAIARPPGWVAPFVAFGIVLVGLAGTLAWAVRHRHDG
jgi:hypothetical protein